MSYKAFISYSHAADNQLAPTLQSALQRFAKPFYRLRAMNVFRDKTSLHLTPKLWPLIQQALSESEYFILLASPEAASSQWVQAEVEEWLKLKNGSLNEFLIVLTDGEILWDRASNDFDWNKTTALPRGLQGKFATEPLFSDLRWAKKNTDLSLRHPQFLDDIGTIGATLHGKPKDIMIGNDVRQHRVFKLVSIAAILVLVISLMGTSVAAYYANVRRKEADDQRVRAVEAAQKERTAREEADRQRGIADKERENAEKSAEKEKVAREAETQQRKKAEQATRNEKVARQSAEERRVEAEHQRNVAFARQLAAQSEATRSEQGNFLQRSALLGIEAMKRAVELSLPSLEPDQALRHGLALLPRPVSLLQDAEDHAPFYSNSPSSITFSPNGKTLAAKGKIWEAWNTTRPKEVMPLFSDGPVAVSSDGRYYAISNDKSVLIWDVESRQNIATIPAGEQVLDLAFSPDRKYLIVATPSGFAKVWEGWQTIRPTRAASIRAYSRTLSVSSDGRYLAMVGGNYTVAEVFESWQTDEYRSVIRVRHEGNVTSMAFSPDTKYLATGAEDGTARLWEMSSGKEIARFGHENNVRDVTFSLDGKYLATASDDGTARIWELNERKEVARVALERGVIAVAFSPDGQYFATGTFRGVYQIWEGFKNNDVRIRHSQSVEDIAFSPDGRYLASACSDGYVWEVASGKQVTKMPHHNRVYKVAFSPDGKYLVTAGGSSAKVWNVTTGDRLMAIDAGDVNAVDFSPDGKYLITASKHAKIWNVANGREMAQIPYESDVKDVAFSRDGNYVAIGGREGTVQVWQAWLTPGPSVAMQVKHKRSVNAVTFSADGRYLATASDDRTVRVWKVKGGEEVALLDHTVDVNNVAFSPDGQYLVTGADDRIGRVWDLASRQVIAHLPHEGYSHSISAVAFSPDGKYIATASKGGRQTGLGGTDDTAQIWYWRPGDLISETCSRLTRNLSVDEWHQYLGEDVPYRKTCENLPVHSSFIGRSADARRQ